MRSPTAVHADLARLVRRRRCSCWAQLRRSVADAADEARNRGVRCHRRMEPSHSTDVDRCLRRSPVSYAPPGHRLKARRELDLPRRALPVRSEQRIHEVDNFRCSEASPRRPVVPRGAGKRACISPPCHPCAPQPPRSSAWYRHATGRRCSDSASTYCHRRAAGDGAAEEEARRARCDGAPRRRAGARRGLTPTEARPQPRRRRRSTSPPPAPGSRAMMTISGRPAARTRGMAIALLDHASARPAMAINQPARGTISQLERQ